MLDLLKGAVDLETRGELDSAILLLGEGLDAQGWPQGSLEVPPLTHYLAFLCERVGKPELGIAYVRKCLASFPNDLGSLYTLAQLLILTGQRDAAGAAVEAFRIACESSDEVYRREWAELVGPIEKDLDTIR